MSSIPLATRLATCLAVCVMIPVYAEKPADHGTSISHASKPLPKTLGGRKAAKAAKDEKHDAHEEESSHWSYIGPRTGPSNWGKLNPTFGLCDSGKEQSPVNLTGAAAQDLEKIKYSYGMSKLQIVNNGHTIQVNVDPGSWIDAFGDRFELKQFHFHTPSEEQINGKSFALVAHFVHKSELGKLAVIAVLFKVGRENALINTLWERMPDEHGEARTYEQRVISPASLMPDKPGYYSLMGSLTTPPCSEGVRWIVLKTPVELSAAQLARFRKEFPMNARPIQPLNGRIIVDVM